MSKSTVIVNRAPVLTLWAAIVAERMGFDREAALTLGKALAGLNAQAKGRSIGIFNPPKPPAGERPEKHGLGEDLWIDLCGRPIPAKNTDQGIRAVVKDAPIDPGKVQGYLERAFGDDLAGTREAMAELARAATRRVLAENAFRLYERFRPEIARGKRGWGQKGVLDLDRIRSLAGEI